MHQLALSNCRAVRQAVNLGARTAAEVQAATGLSRTSTHHHLTHNVWDGHLRRTQATRVHRYSPAKELRHA